MLLLGAALGTYLLMRTDARLLMLWLGLFVVVYSTYSLLTPKGFRQLAPAWSIPAGGVGGLCGALFGTAAFSMRSISTVAWKTRTPSAAPRVSHRLQRLHPHRPAADRRRL